MVARLLGLLAPPNFAGALRSDLIFPLSPREEKIVRMRFGIGEKAEHTLEETGKIFGVTRERIRQIESSALKKLRHRKLDLANSLRMGQTMKDINGFLTKEET